MNALRDTVTAGVILPLLPARLVGMALRRAGARSIANAAGALGENEWAHVAVETQLRALAPLTDMASAS